MPGPRHVRKRLPFGGYFNSNSTTIPWAQRTGNLTLQPYSVVAEILYDEKTNKAKGVLVIDAQTKKATEYGACMASTGNQNPSLTFMALTARAANHAIEEMKKQNL